MKVRLIIFIGILAFTALVPMVHALSKPILDIPSNWFVRNDFPYPDYEGQHDPIGAGKLEYKSRDLEAFVDIYYESALRKTYSNNSLVDEAIAILKTYQNLTILDSGVMTIAGVPAGYANYYYFEYDTFYQQFVLIKDSYYFDILIAYKVGSHHKTEALIMINSLRTSAPEETAFPTEFIIIGAIAGEVAILATLVALTVKTARTEF